MSTTEAMPEAMFDGRSRILVVGTSGSGKSTFAGNLSRIFGLKDIELDALFWKANWTQSDPEEFRDKIARAIGKAGTLRVGFLEGAKHYPDGTSVAAVAAVLDFGAPRAGIPPRPFFRNMIAAKKSEWPDAIAKLLVANDYDADKTLRQAGAAIVGQLQQSIRDTNAPPLKMS